MVFSLISKIAPRSSDKPVVCINRRQNMKDINSKTPKQRFAKSELTTEELIRLAQEQIYCVNEDNFLSEEIVNILLGNLELMKPSSEKFLGGADINRIGIPWFTSRFGVKDETRYFEAAKELGNTLKKLSYPYLPPIDYAIRALDELWPGGALLGRQNGQPMAAGLIRDIEAGKGLPYHVDADCHGPHGKRGTYLDQASQIWFGNIYLKVDNKSGQLDLLDKRPNPLAYQYANDTGAGTSHEYKPDFTYQPRSGALIIAPADKYHRVRATDSRRITCSFFVAVRGFNDPLVIYS